MPKKPYLSMVEMWKKMILDTDPDPDQSQSLIYWSLTEDLSFHKIWFKTKTKTFRYPAYRQTDRRMPGVSQHFHNFVGGVIIIIIIIIIIITITVFLFQRLSMALQQGNAVAFQNTMSTE